jgi:hypothetical protein
LWIVEPPLSTGEQMSVNDPKPSAKVLRTGHRNPWKRPFKRISDSLTGKWIRFHHKLRVDLS